MSKTVLRLSVDNGQIVQTRVKYKPPTPGWHIKSGLSDIPADDVEMRMKAVGAYALQKFDSLAQQGEYPAVVSVTDSNGVTHIVNETEAKRLYRA